MAKLAVFAFLAVVVVHTTAQRPVCLPQLTVTKNVQLVVHGTHLCPDSTSNTTALVTPELMRYVNKRSPRGCRILDMHLPRAHHCRETGQRNPRNRKTIALVKATLTCSDPCDRHNTQSALRSSNELREYLRLKHRNRTEELGLEFEANIAFFKGRRSDIKQICQAGDAGGVRSDLPLKFCDCPRRCPPLLQYQLACPAVPPGTFGICVERCNDCTEDQKCCSNGCGHVCMDASRLPYYEWFNKCVGSCNDTVGQINRPLIGAYIPQCEADGSFSRVQVWGSTGFSWCVDRESGKPVSEAFSPGQMAECPDDDYDYGSGGPQVQYQAVCPVPSGFGTCVEQCSSDSDCGEGMKCCSNGCGHVCSTPDDVPYFEAPDRCRDSCAYITSRMGPAPPGAYTPQCEEDGSFSPTQIWASPGLSWCVETQYGTPTSGFHSPGQTPDC